MRIALSATTILMLAAPAHAALVISTDATSNVTCSAGVCSATAADAVLNVTDLTTMLAAGSLTVQSGSTAQDILVEAPFSWTNSNALTLDSYRAITVDKPISDAGPAALNVAYNDGGTGGELLFRYKGRISFTSTKNGLAINGQSYALLSDIASMASTISNNPSGFYALSNNYDASKDGTYSLPPIATNFDGGFEGLGNTISNLSIDCERDKPQDLVGLFSVLDAGGAIKSLWLDRISYIDRAKKSQGAGGLVALNSRYLFDDHVSGKIIAKVGVGGLAASNEGILNNSSADVKIKSIHSYSGGLVAANGAGGTITASYATGNVKGSAVGGLVGDSDQASILNSYSTGDVQGSFSYTGGFIAQNEANASITSSYSIGKVPWDRSGFVSAGNSLVYSDCYWDTETSGTKNGAGPGNVAGITGLKTEKFKAGLPTGFDPSVWAQDAKINNGYPT